MRNNKTITLSLLITFVVLTAIFVATRSSQGRHAAQDKRTIKVLRKKNERGVKPTAQEIAAQLPQVERELEDRIPKHLPIKVKVKNLEKVKDLKNSRWIRDIEIEVQNTGDKPIYCLRLALFFQDVKMDSGYQIGFPFQYGRVELVDLENRATPQDVPIRPGETHVFKVPEGLVKGWEGYKSKNHKADPKKVGIRFDVLNHGDGTGFVTTDGLSVPKQKAFSEEKKPVATALKAKPKPSWPPDSSRIFQSSFLSASFMPINFFVAKVIDSTYGNEPPQSGLCCPSTSCYNQRIVAAGNCFCPDVPPLSTRSINDCNDSYAYCSTQEVEAFICPDNEHTCTNFFLTRCSTGDPVPTPGGSPSPPPPSPSATPASGCTEDCTRCNPNGRCETNFPPAPFCKAPDCLYGPSADFCSYPLTGCPDNAYYDRSGCCKCANENPSCPDGYYWDKDRCDCLAAPTPVPSATPTPGGGGGGGYYYSYSVCTEYDWVTYESYDGGQTWHEVDRTHAGCW